jgi:hypothetical protein
MTAQEMIDKFGINYTQEINAEVPGWEGSEILHWLNKAQEDIIQSLYSQGNFTDLNELLVNKIIAAANLTLYTSVGGLITNAYALDLSDSSIISPAYDFYVESYSKATRTNPTISDELFRNQFIDKTQVHKFATTAFNKPWFKQPVIFEDYYATGGYPILVVVYDYYTTTYNELRLSYIRTAPEISVTPSQDSLLNVNLHSKIVDRAVLFAIEAMQNQRIQTQPLVNN